jgi:tetratricopeptide (TPR) repeat protein
MISKENAVTLPLLILLYDAFFAPAGRGRGPALIFLALLPVVPLLYLSVPAAARFILEGRETEVLSRSEYFFTQLNVLRDYLGMSVWPSGQTIDHAVIVRRTLFEPATLLSAALHGALLTGAWLGRRRERAAAFCVFAFYLLHLPESSVLPIRDVMVEHRMYLPMAAWAAAVPLLLRRAIPDRRIFSAALGFALAVFAVLTINRNFVWRDDVTLWTDAMKKSPRSERPYHNLGTAYQNRGELDRSVLYYTKALEINPRLAKPHNAMGVMQAMRGERDLAAASFRKAIEIDPRDADAYINLGATLLAAGKAAEALNYFQKALELKPEHPDLHWNLGLVYVRLGRAEELKLEIRRLVQLDRPDLAQKLRAKLAAAEPG